MNYKDLPIVGEIKIPLRISSYTNKENSKNNFCCGFANFKLQDSIADVSEGDKNIGHLGGAFGGFYEIVRYFPEHKKFKESYRFQLNTDDIWNSVEEVLENLSTNPDQFSEFLNKMDEYKKKKEEESNLKEMQKEAEEEAELNRLIAEEEEEIKKLKNELGDE